MDLLKRQKAIQAEMRLKAGTAWENADFIFTNECGHHFDNSTIYRALGQFTRNYTQTTKRGLLTTNKG